MKHFVDSTGIYFEIILNTLRPPFEGKRGGIEI